MSVTKQRICVVATKAITIRTFLLDQLVFLSKNGFDITIICDYDQDLSATCPKELNYLTVPMERSTSVFSTVLGIYLLFKILRKNRFDMMQYCTPKAAFVSSLASWLAGVPVRLYCQWGIRYVGMMGLPRNVLKLIEKIICRLSTHISPDSYGNLDFSVSEGIYEKNKASVVHFGSANGVDLNRFDFYKRSGWRAEIRMELGLSETDFVFGWVGRVTRDKGVSELIGAFLEVVGVDSNSHLLMVGGTDENHGLPNEVISRISLHPNIHYIGPKKTVEKYYAAMDILVAPSYREGFGVVALEAQALGVPVITTDIPGPREAVVDGKTGLLVPVAQISPLVTAMLRLKNDTALVKLMGEEGIKYVQSHFEQGVFWFKVLEHRKNLLHGRHTVSGQSIK